MSATAQPVATIDQIPADLRRKPFDTDELLRRVRRLVGATARI